MVRLWSGRNKDAYSGPMATRLREYRVSEKMSQLIEFLHVKIWRICQSRRRFLLHQATPRILLSLTPEAFLLSGAKGSNQSAAADLDAILLAEVVDFNQ
jgi:hypothetical protein